MKFTVLGSSGFIGTHLSKFLKKSGYECFCPKKDNDIFNQDLGHVIYAIGLTADFRAYPFKTIEAHVCVLKELLEKGTFSSLTYLSSTRVYAGLSKAVETSTLQVNPSNSDDLYNISKLMGESLALQSGKQNIKVVRLSNIIGQRDDEDFFIDKLLKEGFETNEIIFQTSLQSQKDYLYIDDAVRLITQIAASEKNGIFNVASGENTTHGEVAQIIHSNIGFCIKSVQNAPIFTFATIDTAKVKNTFGFKPQHFYEYFVQFLKKYQQKRKKYDLS